MRDFDYTAATDFLESFFSGAEHVVEIRALPNDRSGSAKPLFGGDTALIHAHCRTWDKPGWGVFFGCCTRIRGRPTGARADLAELVALWCDIDCYKHALPKEEVTKALKSCPIPPTVIIDSGGGIHAYWLLRETIDVRLPESSIDTAKEEIDATLRQLAGVFAGDRSVCELARVLRLPGTHNTKGGESRLVELIDCDGPRWELAELQDILAWLGPVLVRPPEPDAPKEDETDPFLGFGRQFGFKAPIDVVQRLSQMRWQGPSPYSIHETRLSVSSSLAAQGMDEEAIFDMLLEATKRAVGLKGQDWNWRREERTIREEIRTAQVKYAPKESAEPARPVVQLRQTESAKAEEAPSPDAGAPPKDSKPTIRVLAGALHDTATAAENVLKEMGAPLYTRSGSIVRPVIEDVEAARGKRTKIARLAKMSVVGMVDWLSRYANWLKYDARSKKWITVDPPVEVAATILSRDGEWKLPPIVSVITTPTLRPDGSLLIEPGYDEATRLLLMQPPPMPPMPATPSRADAETALALLTGLLTEFSFVNDASRSVALSALITPVVRGALSVVPLHVMRAPAPGSGKSYLVDLSSAIATGQRCPVITAGKTEEEQEKRLGAALLSGQAIVSIDNLNGELGGDALCQMVERPVVRVRPLGRSDLVQVETKVTAFATGNNIVVVGDMVRRTVMCSLDADLERPELRCFAQDPLDLVLLNRGDYIAACITIVRAYKAAGFPQRLPSLASYENWSLLVRSALVWLGCSDPVDTMEAARDEDPVTTEIRNIFVGWESAIGFDKVSSATEIIKIANEIEYELTDDPYQKSTEKGLTHGEFREALMAVAGDGKTINSRRLGWWLTRNKGRLVDGVRVVLVRDSHTKSGKWSLKNPANPANPANGGETCG